MTKPDISPAPTSKAVPKSALTAFGLLLAAHEQQKQELARTICDELAMPLTSTFDLQAGTITAPGAPTEVAA